VIVADTGAILALLDKGDRHHAALREIFEERPDQWLLPWAILPEVDYLAGSELGVRAQEAFNGRQEDLFRARAIGRKYRALRLGLVDTVVMAVAERIRADAIATLDLRHFGAVEIAGSPRLLPRDKDLDR
jgi:uncharacterized protein